MAAGKNLLPHCSSTETETNLSSLLRDPWMQNQLAGHMIAQSLKTLMVIKMRDPCYNLARCVDLALYMIVWRLHYNTGCCNACGLVTPAFKGLGADCSASLPFQSCFNGVTVSCPWHNQA